MKTLFDKTETKMADSRELAEMLKLSKRTIANYRKTKRIPYIKISPKIIMYDVDAVKAALMRGMPGEGTGEFIEEGRPA